MSKFDDRITMPITTNTDSTGRCSGCGLAIDDGDRGCSRLFQQMTGRSFTDIRFGRAHGMIVDTYALQHPDRYCISAKSLAAHLCGLCHRLQRGGDTALPDPTLRRWLDGPVIIAKPKLPALRGETTIADIVEIEDPGTFTSAVADWSKQVWAAYGSLHRIARQWLDEAAAAPIRRHDYQ